MDNKLQQALVGVVPEHIHWPHDAWSIDLLAFLIDIVLIYWVFYIIEKRLIKLISDERAQ